MLLRPLVVIMGLGLLAWFLVHLGLRPVLQQLRHLGVGGLFCLLIPYAVGTSLGALPWAALLPNAVRPSLNETIASRFAASAANMLLPLFGVAGEPTRLLWLRPDARTSGTAAIVVDRVQYNLGSQALLFVGAAAALFATELPSSVGLSAATAASISTLLTLALSWGAIKGKLGNRAVALVRRFTGRLNDSAHIGREFDGALRELVKRQRFRLLLGVLVHFLSRVIIGLEVYVGLRILAVSTSPANVVVLMSVPIATALVASTIPSQIGVQEGAQALVCAGLGINPAIGFALVLLQRLRQLIFLFIAPVMIGIIRARTTATSQSRRSGCGETQI